MRRLGSDPGRLRLWREKLGWRKKWEPRQKRRRLLHLLKPPLRRVTGPPMSPLPRLQLRYQRRLKARKRKGPSLLQSRSLRLWRVRPRALLRALRHPVRLPTVMCCQKVGRSTRTPTLGGRTTIIQPRTRRRGRSRDRALTQAKTGRRVLKAVLSLMSHRRRVLVKRMGPSLHQRSSRRNQRPSPQLQRVLLRMPLELFRKGGRSTLTQTLDGCTTTTLPLGSLHGKDQR
mmetsp:Transcript_18701/g.37940  ORF Transcript_18701/g.37940 Transcript_18701/m.37940 type:complete len:230 (-) Transcript_18701:1124-1813(-)